MNSRRSSPRGNVVDLAVERIIIRLAAFHGYHCSLVADLINDHRAAVTGGVDFLSNLFVNLGAERVCQPCHGERAGAPVFAPRVVHHGALHQFPDDRMGRVPVGEAVNGCKKNLDCAGKGRGSRGCGDCRPDARGTSDADPRFAGGARRWRDGMTR
jgi:hypothetical protein